MSKINAVRLINLNYNHNGIRVDDETFHLNGESSLFTLRNGGGKSVLVQMLIAPFVHKRYRDMKDRKFSEYFTTNKPSFILTEWKLDGNGGYVLIGMMVRKSQEIKEDQQQNDLDMIQFIYEYKEQNSYDIHQIPFIKDSDERKTLKTFSECRSILDSLKTSSEYRFSSYDMNNSVQSRNYYTKLEEYQIYYKEWESIIRKINLRESGLSELFTNAKDEAGLIETWFLPTVEDKLNKDKDRIEEFRDILGKYIKQYKENKSKINQKNTIALFKEKTGPVLEIAKNLESYTSQRLDLGNKIATLIIQLRKLKDDLEGQKDNLEAKEDMVSEEIHQIEYEEISFALYGLKDEELAYQNQYEEINSLVMETEEDKKSLIKDKNIQNCAKINEQYRDASLNVQELENKLEIIKDKEKDRTPERESLGYTLRHHYEGELQTIENKIAAAQESLRKIEEADKSLEEAADRLKREEIGENSRLAKINTNVSNYDKTENSFNKSYKEDLKRNILGEYEKGSLDIRIKRLKEELEELSLEIVRLKKLSIENDEKLKGFNRQIQDKTSEHATISQKILGLEEAKASLEGKIETRRSIIKHIGFKEEQLFDTEDILKEFKRRKDGVSEDIKVIEIRIRDLQNEYNKLQSGQVLELPDDIKEALDNQGINYVYGTDWLKKNKKSPDENSRIVKNNPFIPYGIILTKQDISKLKANNLDIYTSFPIPIVIRENLEKKFESKAKNNDGNNNESLENQESSIYSGDKVSFYVLFNNNLLDEKELNKILALKAEDIENTQTALEIRQDDFNEYQEKYNKIFYQNLTKKDYADTIKKITDLETAKASLEKDLASLRDQEKNTKKDQEKLSETINTREKNLDKLSRKQGDLLDLQEEYKKYLLLMEDRIEVNNNIVKIRADSKSVKEESQSLRQNRQNTLESKLDYQRKQKDIKEKLQEYLRYGETQLIQKDIEDIEARYVALTKEITSELKDIEVDLSKAHTRFTELEKDLIDTSRRLNIGEVEYIDVKYDSYTLESIEDNITSLESKLKDLNNKSSDLKSNIAVKENQITTEMKKLKDSLDKEDLLAKSEIVETNFKERIVEKKDQLKQLKVSINRVAARIGYCDNNLSALAEYFDLRMTEEVELDKDISLMDKETLDRFRGTLVRDYRNMGHKIVDLKGLISTSLDELLRDPAFQEESTSRPLKTLYSVIEEPTDFIQQLTTTISAYDDLMAKLEVDIGVIDKEKARITQILLEYIREIHKNLGKIDKNSTIKIKDKPVKMLRIELPDWDKQESQYETRLKDMIDDLTESGINRLEDNENIEEVISPIITTNNLYNTVVGISNIRIKLYKIEAQRQYQINWADVSQNSGGEGFLSAFVILSSLLSFMRRDDTDIFAESEEGKVLIMDNPFAQTNAAHLLEPLMDVAKKSNTQLIAFTGLSGEAIYNSFDNIYVLNLIPSKLKKGMQYLKSNHTKGEETEVMISSQVRVEEMEQMTLF